MKAPAAARRCAAVAAPAARRPVSPVAGSPPSRAGALWRTAALSVVPGGRTGVADRAGYFRLQAKLAVGAPSDPLERQADRMADAVTASAGPRAPLAPAPPRVVQRACACGSSSGPCHCPEKEELRRQASGERASPIPEGAAVRVQSLGAGEPLSRAVRERLEPWFERDLGEVRIHRGGDAAAAAEGVHALAYTLGRDIVFGRGQFAPGTRGGDHLLAHELTHVVQQGSARRQLQRAAAPSGTEECPGYDPTERETSHTERGVLDPDVSLFEPGKLLIADFGVDWRHVKSSTRSDPLLASWLARFETDSSYRLEIVGYTDCVGAERWNTDLRQGRARAVEALLGPQALSRVTFRGMMALGTYVTDNAARESRARNRAVVIEFRQQYSFEEEEVEVQRPRMCGPDLTRWLIDQMTTNQNHPTIRKMREYRWPRYVPVFNIGWTAAALADFASLVRGGAVWDFKSHSRALGWRYSAGQHCPTSECDLTVTLCGTCLNYDVPGNIHFGWIGRRAEVAPWTLRTGAGIAQRRRWTDDPKDAVAVDIGMRMADSGTTLCTEVAAHRSALNLEKTPGCNACQDGPHP